jgi:hypothetical protein
MIMAERNERRTIMRELMMMMMTERRKRLKIMRTMIIIVQKLKLRLLKYAVSSRSILLKQTNPPP